MTSTALRKQVATLSHFLNLQNDELDQLEGFLGQDINVHRNFYRLPTSVAQVAKTGKLLLAIRKTGSLKDHVGKTLEEVEWDGQILPWRIRC